MFSKVFIFLFSTAYVYYQVIAAEEFYVGELQVESNVTLEPTTLLAYINKTSQFVVNTNNVLLEHAQLSTECLLIGTETYCNCSDGFVWSNELCYSYNCCRETTCTANVSSLSQLCIPRVNVRINGSVRLDAEEAWGPIHSAGLTDSFEKLNGLQVMNISSDVNTATFETSVSVNVKTEKLQEVVDNLKMNISSSSTVLVDTEGMVTILSPNKKVCYDSSPVMKCYFEEATDSSAWHMSRSNERFQLADGSVVTVTHVCTAPDNQYSSCVELSLNKVTASWTGNYECSFTKGSVRHIARTSMTVAILPDSITLAIDPIAVQCQDTGNEVVKVTATVPILKDNLDVTWQPKPLDKTDNGTGQVFKAEVPISCVKTTAPHIVTINFNNDVDQNKKASVDIPVIYAGDKSCPGETLNGIEWPDSPLGNTVITHTCPEGRVGHKMRTCKQDGTWDTVFSACVDQELNKVNEAAENFLKGLGATEEVAMNIFSDLNNITSTSTESNDSIADISASINILTLMASATKKVVLNDAVLPNLVEAASNVLNKTWDGVNSTVVQSMSASYLGSLEGLVKNINVNNTGSKYKNQNLELDFCTDMNCNVSVFDTKVDMNMSGGLVKAMAVKNLVSKLKNNFKKHSEPISILLSATHVGKGNASGIKLTFPSGKGSDTKPHCVYWDTNKTDWSDQGCKVIESNENFTVCKCNHLTSFSALMSKTATSDPVLEAITHVGMGVSICSLLIFLIIEFLVWSAVVKTNLSHFRHTALVNIATFLLLADCCFLASSSPRNLSETTCLVLTVCKHLFYLAMFSWMLCMSVMLVHQLIFVFSPLRKKVFMFLSSIVGYVCPILIVMCSYIYCKYTKRNYFNRDTCWLIYERILEGSMHAFILPIGTVIFTNIFSMVVVIVTLVKASAPDSGKADDKETAKSIIRVVVFLTPVFGVTWIIGFFLLMLDPEDPMMKVAEYSFTILNAFQGLFVLITGVFAEQKVRQEVVKIVMAKSGKGNNSTTVTKDK